MGKGPFFGRCSKAGPARHLWRCVLGIVRSLICPEKRAGHAPALQGQRGCIVGAHLCVRPCTKAACVQRADTSVGPYRGNKRFLYFDGVANVKFVQRAGHAPPLQNERSVTWRSGLLICVPFTKTNMRTPGPGPQARCGKGVWSPEDQGDRCRVPRSFGPSGAGGEQRTLLKRNQQDDHTKRTRPAGLHLIRPPDGGHLPL